MQQAHIKIIYTGGTIGMAPDVANGRLKPYSLDLLLAAIPELKKCLVSSITAASNRRWIQAI